MRFYFRRLFTFVCCLFAYTFMFGGKSFAKPGDYLLYYLGRDFRDESLRCCCCDECFLDMRNYLIEKDPLVKLFGVHCYVKYNEGENIEDVFEAAKAFNNSKDCENLRKKFFDDVDKIKSYEEADELFKTYLKNLKGLFCRQCMLLTLLASNTQEYHEFRNKPLEDVVPGLSSYDGCVICLGSLSGDLARCKGCLYFFHRNCILSWFERQEEPKTCPFCKLDVSRTKMKSIRDDEVMEDKRVKYKNNLFDDSFHKEMNQNEDRFRLANYNKPGHGVWFWIGRFRACVSLIEGKIVCRKYCNGRKEYDSEYDVDIKKREKDDEYCKELERIFSSEEEYYGYCRGEDKTFK